MRHQDRDRGVLQDVARHPAEHHLAHPAVGERPHHDQAGLDPRRGVEQLLGAGLAGIAGTVLVTYFPTSPSVGFSLMPIIIIATTIGGLGSIGGTFLGGIFCGVVQQVTAMMWNSALQDVPLYALLLLFIAFRPTGFFGVRSE